MIYKVNYDIIFVKDRARPIFIYADAVLTRAASERTV